MEGDSFVLDPRDFITPPYIRCPFCGAAEFGVLMVTARSYRRRCRACMKDEGYDLPPLDKKVVYLDQFAISQMMKVLHPEHRDRMPENEAEYWTALFDRLDRLVKLHVLVCPSSSAQWEESIVSRVYEALRAMYGHLAGECSFRDEGTVKRFQLHRAFRAWLADEGPPDVSGDDALHGRRDQWLDRLRVDARMDPDNALINELRATRARVHDGMRRAAKTWRDEDRRPFEERFERELRGYGPSLMQRYYRRVFSVGQAVSGQRAFTEDDVFPTNSQLIVMDLKDALAGRGGDEAVADGPIAQFFQSEALAQVPFLRMSCGLLAALATEISEGRGADPDRGMVQDIGVISTLLPHCDAMLIDNRAHRLLSLADERLHFGYDTAIFSTRTRNDLLYWLDDLESGVSDERRALVIEVYGESWLKPFRELYTWQDRE